MWTRNKPTREGLYWYRPDEHNEQFIVDVYEFSDRMEVVPYTSYNQLADSGDNSIDNWNGEWWDTPIIEP